MAHKALLTEIKRPGFPL